MKTNILQSIIRSFGRHKGSIYIGLGTGGLLAAVPLAVVGTVKAVKKVQARKDELEVDHLEKKEVVKVVYRCYIPTASTILISLLALYSGTREFKKRNVAMASAVAASDLAFETYKAKVKDLIGKEKAKEVETAIIQDKADNSPAPTREVVIMGNSERLCYDPYSGRYFKIEPEQLKAIANELNRDMIQGLHGYVSLNEYYDLIPLEHIKRGYDIGWNIVKGMIEIKDSEAIKSPDGEWATVVDFFTPPYDGFEYV